MERDEILEAAARLTPLDYGVADKRAELAKRITILNSSIGGAL